MASLFNIIPTKLLPPRIADVIQCPRLESVISQIGRPALTTVTAGAGYGKTTLVAQALLNRDGDTIWYGLDGNDGDLATFYHYLCAGIRKIIPHFNIDHGPGMLMSPSHRHSTEALLGRLLSKLERVIHKELVIVMDDFHLIEDRWEISRGVQFLIDYLPPQLHLVLISRTNIDLRLSRYIAQRNVLEVTESDLRFTAADVQSLFQHVFEIDLSDSQARELCSRTGGWVSGAILFYHGLKGVGVSDITSRLIRFSGDHGSIVRYLEENVFDRLTARQIEFLTRTAILDRLHVPFCNRLLATNQSARILKHLESRHLFTFAFDEDPQCYYYHHLFREFLRTKLHKDMPVQQLRDLHLRAGRLYEADGIHETALDHFIEADATQDAVRIITRIGRNLIIAGRRHQIESYLERLSLGSAAEQPWVQFLAAGAQELAGHPAKAVQGYARALDGFKRTHCSQAVQTCLMSLATSHRMTGDFERAEKAFKDLLAQPSLPLYYRISACGSLAGTYPFLGKLDAAEKHLRRGRRLLPDLDDPFEHDVAKAWLDLKQAQIDFCMGDFEDMLASVDVAQKALRIHSHGSLMAVSRLVQARALMKLGRYSEGKDALQDGFNLIAKIGLKGYIYPWLLLCDGHCTILLGDWQPGYGTIKKSLDVFERQGSRSGQAAAWITLASAELNCGNWIEARALVDKGRTAIDGLPLVFNWAWLNALDAVLSAVHGDLDCALDLLDKAASDLPVTKWYLAWLDCQYARVYWHCHKAALAVEKIQSCLLACRQYGYRALIMEEKSWVVPLLVETCVHSRRPELADHIQGLILAMAHDAKIPLSGLTDERRPAVRKTAIELLRKVRKAAAPSLKVYLMGRFAAYLGDEKISDHKWKNKKAMTLFKYLAFGAQGGYLPKEVLMEILWPDEEARKSAKRFHVTLAALRKILEPDITKGTPSAYLLSNRDAYRLHTGNAGWIDTESFGRELMKARQVDDPGLAVACYRQAASYYLGDFLEEDRYDEWCREPRERFKEDYLNALTELMRHYDQQQDDANVIRYAGKYLKIDPYAEPIYRMLMCCHARMGNKAMVVKTFRKCQKLIGDELDCPLSAKSTRLYERLIAA